MMPPALTSPHSHILPPRTLSFNSRRNLYFTPQDALNVDAFSSSDEAFAADALFLAYKSGQEDSVRKLIKDKSIFKNLDNQVSGVP